MLLRRLLAGEEPWKFKGMWNWFFLKLSVALNGEYLAQIAIPQWSEVIGVSPFHFCPIVTILFFYISFFLFVSPLRLMPMR